MGSTTLLTMPFGALQTIAILIGCFSAQRFSNKAGIFAFLMAVAVGGCVMLYTQALAAYGVPALTQSQQSISLGGYYLL